MAPFRNAEREQASTSSHPYNTSHLPPKRPSTKASQGIVPSIPVGTSKIKGQIRQTKRLLNREDLTPDVKLVSERRLITLEAELVKASVGALEIKMVTRYRGIKFFERQKVLRKIKQAKKALVASPEDVELVKALLESRIDLHYILNYPKIEKYTALFPDGTYVPHSPAPISTPSSKKKDPAAVRARLRESIRLQLIAGTLVTEVEGGDLGIEGVADVGSKEEEEESGARVEGDVEPKAKKVKVSAITVTDPTEKITTSDSTVKEKKDKKEKKSKKEKSVPEEPVKEGWIAEGDDFFA